MLLQLLGLLLVLLASGAGFWFITHPRQFTEDRADYLRRLPSSIGSDPDLWYWRVHRVTAIAFCWLWVVGVVAGVAMVGTSLLTGHGP